MKYITDPAPKVALKRNLTFWRLYCLASIVYKTSRCRQTPLSVLFSILGFWQSAAFSSASLGWFQTRRLLCPICTLYVWQHLKGLQENDFESATCEYSEFFSWWLQFTCQGPCKSSNIFLMLWRGEKSNSFLESGMLSLTIDNRVQVKFMIWTQSQTFLMRF